MAKSGVVYLVGAGPGDPELLTLKALRLIETANVVVYDRLVSDEVLTLIPQGTTRIDVGKRPGSHPVPQEEINRTLVSLARSDRVIVRLKGGDPLIFGRGGEEIDALLANGIEVKTIPGITAAQGCAASLNLALTQRDIAHSVTYLTGHLQDGLSPDIDWGPVASGKTTLAVYMGLSNLEAIVKKLTAAGVGTSMPAVVVCNGTTRRQVHISTCLSRLVKDVEDARFDGPVIFIIGEAAQMVAQNGDVQNANEDFRLAAGGV